VHHSQRELNVLTSFRAHPFVHVSFMLSLIPALVVSTGVALPLGVLTAYVCANAMTHANVRWAYGPVGKLLVSPRYHRLHHELGGDMGLNLGAVLTIWDLLARRAVFPSSRAAVPSTGLAAGTVPIEQEPEEHRPVRVLWAQLAEPFIRSGPLPLNGTPSPAGTRSVVDPEARRPMKRLVPQ
jgi:sterol desaturase/sphingolipid hydroxylase (fatty acid hydroxylase superfamily)